MPERRVLLFSQLAERTRQRDVLLMVAALAAALSVAYALDQLSGLGAGLIALVFVTIAAARLRVGGQRLVRRAERVLEMPAEGLPFRVTRSVIERLPDPVLLLDSDGRVLLSNRTAHPVIDGAVEKRHVSAVLRAPGVLDAVELVLKGKPAQSVEFSVLVPVERHWVAYVAPVPLTLESSEEPSTGAFVVLHDMTSQKRVEQMRADFVANASHELRTPLSSLSGFIETLRGHAKDDPVAREKFLEIMYDQARRMRRLIEDLLSLSRIELNEHVRPEGAVQLSDVVADVVSSLVPLADSRKVRIETSIPPALPAVIGDRDELCQVVQNLIDNAIKYGASGERIEVKVGSAEDPSGRKSQANFIAVRDFGEGIAREHLPRLTERFYRVDVQRSRQTGGTGLGLAIVKHIVNRHRGWLSIESKLGEGSTFTVFLPQAPRSPLQHDEPAKDAA